MKGVKTVLSKTIKLETKMHSFVNGWCYVENYRNGNLQDNFFAEKEDLFPDGSMKPNRPKYFYSRDGEEKEVKKIDPLLFDGFGDLCFIDGCGSICHY